MVTVSLGESVSASFTIYWICLEKRAYQSASTSMSSRMDHLKVDCYQLYSTFASLKAVNVAMMDDNQSQRVLAPAGGSVVFCHLVCVAPHCIELHHCLSCLHRMRPEISKFLGDWLFKQGDRLQQRRLWSCRSRSSFCSQSLWKLLSLYPWLRVISQTQKFCTTPNISVKKEIFTYGLPLSFCQGCSFIISFV